MSQSLVNILIVFDDKSDNQSIGLSSAQSNYLFDSMKTSIKQMFGPNKYTVYGIKPNDLKSNDSWETTTALVITIGDHSFHSIDNNFVGNQINFKAKDLFNENNLSFNCDLFKQEISRFLTKYSNSEPIECDSCGPKSSPIYLLASEEDSFDRLSFGPKVHLIDTNCQQLDENQNSDQSLEVILNPKPKDLKEFNSETYFSNLKSERLGRFVVFTDITDTTMKLIETFSGVNGLIAVTNQQTAGRGRSQNDWLSPKGCAMFTIRLFIELKSNIGRKMAFIQHLAGLSVVTAINLIPGYEELQLGLKWPNDILWTKNKAKLCGVLITSTFADQKFNVLIGFGINVSNREPSLCLNEVIDDFNSSSNRRLEYLKCEELIARTVTQLEDLLRICEEVNGLETIQDLYTKYWMHSKEVIKLRDDLSERTVQIEGLDSDGYLLVKDLSDGSTLSLHPDGNRFDIMRNLMIPRKQN